MNLVKGYSPLLDCGVWRVQQFACGKWFLSDSFSVFLSHQYDELGSPQRDYIATRVRMRRIAVREAIEQYQKEQASVSQER